MTNTCPTCEGRRQVPNTLGIGGNPMLPCSPCGGTGTVPDYNSHTEPTPMFECSDCEGTGKSPANPDDGMTDNFYPATPKGENDE